jgi:hypothetical protein
LHFLIGIECDLVVVKNQTNRQREAQLTSVRFVELAAMEARADDVQLCLGKRELSRNLGDENRLKAAYRGGCRALPEPPERSNTPCREIPQSFLSVSLMLSKIP